MAMADRFPKSRRATALITALAIMMMSACIVDSPTIESAEVTTRDSTVEPTADTSPPQFAPTATVPPATPEPSPDPTATSEPTPTPVPTVDPARPTPLPTSAPADEYTPSPVQPGLVTIPIGRISFMLSAPRPVLQLPQHTLIYLDDARDGEVDIFTPAGAADGTPLGTYDALIAHIQTTPELAGLAELSPVTIAGLPTRVFEGTAASTERSFVTELAFTAENLGWFPPARMRLWVIDHPGQAIIISAESLEDPGRYSDSVRLATEVLSTIDFG